MSDKFRFFPTGLDGLTLIEPRVFDDDRGCFLETYNERDFAAAGIDARFVQDNRSKSRRGVLRGLHYQIKNPQGKLVGVNYGEVYDVAVDMRPGSQTLGMSYGVTLSGSNKLMIYVPEGFAHGFLVLSDEAEFEYKCTRFYAPGDEEGILWCDPAIGIEWPMELLGYREPILSEKDKKLPLWKDLY